GRAVGPVHERPADPVGSIGQSLVLRRGRVQRELHQQLPAVRLVQDGRPERPRERVVPVREPDRRDHRRLPEAGPRRELRDFRRQPVRRKQVGASYSIPAGVPQPGVPYLIDSLDGRLTQAVAHNDPSAGAEAVWTQQTVAGSGGRTIVRWYEILPGALNIRQQGQLSSATDDYWNAAISPSIAGNDAMIEYNRGSSTLLSLIGAQTRTSTTPLGQMDAGEVLLGSSSAPDQETAFQTNCTPNPCRWVDYS